MLLLLSCMCVCVCVFTHLPDDKEDEPSAQNQGEHVAEGREGERHGCVGQPDDQTGWGGGEQGKGRGASLTFLSFFFFWSWLKCLFPTSGAGWVCCAQVSCASDNQWWAEAELPPQELRLCSADSRTAAGSIQESAVVFSVPHKQEAAVSSRPPSGQNQHICLSR